MSFIECNCDQDGSLNGNCNDDTGKCDCKPGFDGDKCDTCAKKFFGPQCQGVYLFSMFRKNIIIFSLLSHY